MELVERETQLAALGEHLDAAAAGHGRLVLVGGEAGVGKTTLVKAFAAERAEEARFLWAACDGLFTPQPLGPLFELAEQLKLDIDGPRHEVFAATLEAMGTGPTVGDPRGRALGGRGDARPAPLPRPQARPDGHAPDLHVPRRRDRRPPSASRRDGRRRHDLAPDCAAAAFRGWRSVACARLRGRSARALPPDERKPLLRHGGARGGRRRRPGERPRRRSRTCGPSRPARPRRPGRCGRHRHARGSGTARADARAAVRRDRGMPRRGRAPGRGNRGVLSARVGPEGGRRGDRALQPRRSARSRFGRAARAGRNRFRPAGASRRVGRRRDVRCSSMRRRLPRRQPVSALIRRRQRSTLARFASPRAYPRDPGPSCSRSAPTSAT